MEYTPYNNACSCSKLYSNKVRRGGRPPISTDLIILVIDIKTNNPRFGCPQIAALVKDRTGKTIGNESVRRILKKYFHGSPNEGPSWLTFLGAQADSLWSIDLFRLESILLQTHWILVAMDQFTRRIVGFGVMKGEPTGPRVCFTFNEIISAQAKPKHISRDNDPLLKFILGGPILSFLKLMKSAPLPLPPLLTHLSND